MLSLELKVPPLVVLALFAAAIWAVARALEAATFDLPGSAIIAIVLGVAGFGIATAGFLTFRRHSTTVNPIKPEESSTMVTGGVYAMTRNPMYLGITIALAGWGLYLGNVVALLLLPVFVAYLTRYQIKPEERVLRDRFGKDFTDYAATVRRWI